MNVNLIVIVSKANEKRLNEKTIKQLKQQANKQKLNKNEQTMLFQFI